MIAKNNKIIILLFILGFVLFAYWVWLALRPAIIVSIHHRGSNFNAVLVKNFPFTDKGKIRWWMKNKSILKEKYNVPEPASDGFFYVTIWDFGDGYKEQGKYDRLCFDDMNTKENCIEKKPILTVSNSKNRGTIFTIYDGDDYRLGQNGDIIKID